ncbi:MULTISPECIES: glycosyltransferase family 4 protein [Acidithrix]|uniref:GDP-mannose-dependent alpha-(1-2)-phosphatidylinositol mannosyltransferase n=1 Tax=Acidithrix ferrooxidans TaxID=1280514 RepID=A0A0D8HJM7_9ACTN|nr:MULTISPECIES: glycosyltransferase family 4 protein [Acidithrix]KJF18079.1 GDP-mannose-dependent alpha-(1-2)-phosphatidylinositol mannosyltransferase [Acidithrix ferrooxidans]
MKVAVVCPYSLGFPGGVQSQVVGLTLAMRAHGHEVELFAPCDDLIPPYDMVCLGPSLRLRANGSIAPTGLRPSTMAKLRHELRSYSYDVVHLHEPLAPGPSLVTLASVEIPIVGTFHRQGVSLAYLAFGRAMSPLARRITRRFAVSAEAAKTASRVIGGSYEILGNGVDLGRYSTGPIWPKESPVVLFLGRHENRKGLEVLLRSVELVRSPATFWIAGDGPETPVLHKKFSHLSNVDWLGRISDAEAASRMRAADVFVAPSLFGESFGVVLLEAMAASGAVVASDIRGYREVARKDREALLVAPGDPEALALSIDRVLQDDKLKERLVSSGLQRASEHSIDNLALRYLKAFEESISEAS